MHTSRLGLSGYKSTLCLGCPKTLTCYSIVSKYNDPEKKVKDQVSCYLSSSSVNNHRLNLLLPWHQFHYVLPIGNGKKRNIFYKVLFEHLKYNVFLRLTFSKCNFSSLKGNPKIYSIQFQPFSFSQKLELNTDILF